MPNTRQTTATQSQTRRAPALRRTGLSELFQNMLFALALGFAAAIVFGLVP